MYQIKKYRDILFWIIAFILLYRIDVNDASFTFCLFKLIFNYNCIGCGIGRSIHYALHLEFYKSIQTHFMGIPTIAIILFTIIKQLIIINRIQLKYQKTYK